MVIFYGKYHYDDKEGECITDEEVSEHMENCSISELIQRIQDFVNEHPKAYIDGDTQIYLSEDDKDSDGVTSLSINIGNGIDK